MKKILYIALLLGSVYVLFLSYPSQMYPLRLGVGLGLVKPPAFDLLIAQGDQSDEKYFVPDHSDRLVINKNFQRVVGFRQEPFLGVYDVKSRTMHPISDDEALRLVLNPRNSPDGYYYINRLDVDKGESLASIVFGHFWGWEEKRSYVFIRKGHFYEQLNEPDDQMIYRNIGWIMK